MTLSTQFKCYEVLKRANGLKLAPHEVAERIGVRKNKLIEGMLLKLAKNFKNIYVEEKGEVRVFWWKKGTN